MTISQPVAPLALNLNHPVPHPSLVINPINNVQVFKQTMKTTHELSFSWEELGNIEPNPNSFDDPQPSTSSAGNFDPSSNLIPIECGYNLDDFSTAIRQAAAKSVDQQ